MTDVNPALQAAQLEAAEEGVVEEDADADGEYDENKAFDADEVHEHVAAEEGGDYTEHAEFPDDEDEFGEDLPEEVGGETKDAAYPHIGASDDQPELPQDENDFEREVPIGVVGEHEGASGLLTILSAVTYSRCRRTIRRYRFAHQSIY